MHVNLNLWIIYGYHFLTNHKFNIVVFAVITFQIYNIILSKQKHGIGPIDIIKFNYEL